MAEIRTVVCDLCGQADAKTYAIAQHPNSAWMVDLCDTCALPIDRWRDHARSGPNRRAYRRFNKVPAVPRNGA